MQPEALEVLKTLVESKGLTLKAFKTKYGENADLIREALQLHMDEVKGKLVVNDAGLGVLKMFEPKTGK